MRPPLLAIALAAKTLGRTARASRPAPSAAEGLADATWIALAVAVALAALLVLAIVLVAWWLRRRRVPRRRRPVRPRYPVVLAHGFMGFDEIQVGGATHDYFRGVPARLERFGCVVHRFPVPMAGSVAARAEELARRIRDLGAPRVNVVAHSMGGLDARYAIARLGLSRQVAAVVTVGTPHLGTPLADLSAELGDRFGVLRALGVLGLEVGALHDLTTARMEAFNRDVPDVRGVAYQSVVAVAREKRKMNPLLVAPHLYLQDRAGENDGVVPAGSQRWGEVLAEIEADHWAQIGWSRHFDAPAFYEELLRELRARGF